VRDHSLSKVPVILAIGGREVENRTVTVRRLGSKQTQIVDIKTIIADLVQEATPPDLR
jgi:threonyl-tRNA synthetase